MSQVDLKHRTSRTPAKAGKVRAQRVAATKKSRGASREESPEAGFNIVGLLGQLIRLVVIVLAIGVLGGAGYLGYGVLDKAASRPVKNIGVEGDFSLLSKAEVIDMVTPLLDNGFLQLPIDAVKKQLEANPWVDRAAVTRRWPDTLYVSIVEQKPIARWGNAGFLNQRGEFISAKGADSLANLPLLAGNLGQEKDMMNDFQELAQLLRAYDLKVTGFYCDELYSRTLVLNDNLNIIIGRDEIMQKVQRFLTVYQASLHAEMERVESIDLRYGNGVAVSWKQVNTNNIAVVGNNT